MASKTRRAGSADAYELEEQVGHIFRRAHQRATAIFLDRIGDSQITPTQFAALVKLGDHGELGQNHLGRLTAMDPATIQGVIRRLKARRLILTRADRKDGRRTLLRLSAAGERLVQELIPHGFEVSDAILAPLSPKERVSFLGFLRRLT